MCRKCRSVKYRAVNRHVKLHQGNRELCSKIEPLPVSLAQFCTIFNSNDDVGLKHIINRRSEQGIDVEDFLSNLNEVITQGNLVRSQKTGNFEIWHGGKMAVVSPEFKGNRLMFLLTAFKSRKQKTNP